MSKEYIEALENLKTALHNEWLRFYPQFKELDEKTKFVDGVRMVSSDADAFLNVKQALQRLEAIDNAKPSEALECLGKLSSFDVVVGKTKKYDISTTVGNYFRCEITTIKQALLKAQEPKQYLKWEDLEFDHKPAFTEAKMGETIYKLVIGFDCTGKETIFLRTDNQQIVFHEKDKQFFNDLHLERVEEWKTIDLKQKKKR